MKRLTIWSKAFFFMPSDVLLINLISDNSKNLLIFEFSSIVVMCSTLTLAISCHLQSRVFFLYCILPWGRFHSSTQVFRKLTYQTLISCSVRHSLAISCHLQSRVFFSLLYLAMEPISQFYSGFS